MFENTHSAVTHFSISAPAAALGELLLLPSDYGSDVTPIFFFYQEYLYEEMRLALSTEHSLKHTFEQSPYNLY